MLLGLCQVNPFTFYFLCFCFVHFTVSPSFEGIQAGGRGGGVVQGKQRDVSVPD